MLLDRHLKVCAVRALAGNPAWWMRRETERPRNSAAVDLLDLRQDPDLASSGALEPSRA
jgi:hypothetical protein